MTHVGHAGPEWALLAAIAYAGWLGIERGIKRVREWRAPSDLDRLKQQYAMGEIDLETYERLLEALLDPRHEQIRDTVEEVAGIGRVTADEIALSFESVEELRRADRDQLEDVSNVGPERADAILSRFRR